MASALRGLYAITDAGYCGAKLIDKVTAALRGGVRLVQYRNKQASLSTQQQEAGELVALCHSYHALLIVNDDVALAKAVKAHGVHLGQTDMQRADNHLSSARAHLGKDKIIGITCHQDMSLALQAQQQGADYVAFGRFFPSHTKPTAPAASLDCLRQAKQQLHLPTVAIGGITPDNASDVIQAGADMIAVIHAVFATDDLHQIEHTCQQLQSMFS